MDKEKFKKFIYGQLQLTPYELMEIYIKERKQIIITESVFVKITICFPNWLHFVLQYYSYKFQIPLITKI